MAEAEVATIRLFIGTNTPPGSNPLTLTAQCVATMESEHITYYNVVGSCIVDAGIWVLYNGDNYSHGGIVLTPGTYPDLGLPGLLDSSTSLRSLRPLPSDENADGFFQRAPARFIRTEMRLLQVASTAPLPTGHPARRARV